MKCPICDLDNHKDAIRCVCGFDFEYDKSTEVSSPINEKHKRVEMNAVETQELPPTPSEQEDEGLASLGSSIIPIISSIIGVAVLFTVACLVIASLKGWPWVNLEGVLIVFLIGCALGVGLQFK